MAQKRRITDFLTPSGSRDPRPQGTDVDREPPPKRSSHRDSFDPKWNDEFPWVIYVPPDDDHEPSMFCRICRKHNEASKRMVWLTVPCKLLRKDKLREHERSRCHADAVQAEAIAAAAKRSGGIASCMTEQVSLKRQAVRGAFKCMYWLAKEETAHHTKFSSLLQLAKSLGCSYLSELEIGQQANYTSHRIIDEFLAVLSDCVERDLLSQVKASPAIGILCDESTDISNLKQLVVFVRFLVKGLSRTCFLKMVDLEDGRAETIEKALLDVLQQCKIPISEIFSFGSDGASVMTGRRTGVAKRLKGHNPEMVSLHCGAHRLALASSQAAQHVSYMKTFDAHLVALYYHFKNSSVREAALHEIQEIMGEPVLCLKKAIHTRWLSHDKAVTAIRRTLPSLLTTLEREVAERDDAVACGLVRAIKCYKFIATIYLLSDVLPHLSTLSLVFQRENVDLCIVEPQVAATIASLKHLRNQAGPYLQQLDEALGKLTTEFGLCVTDRMKQEFQQNIREKYIDKLVENLNDRFVDSDLLSALIILFQSSKAAKSMQSPTGCFEEYGDGAVNVIAAHFLSTVDKAKLQLEWMGFKHILVNQFLEVPPNEVMAAVSGDSSFSSLYPCLSKLASIALTLPISTADCERGFSTMNRIKTNPRNRLKTTTLDMLIRLSSEGPSMDTFDYDSAVSVWAQKSKRRITV